jgi:L-ascorbate metabolism protein UlaG (beta-lactamase superfamily)
MVSADHSSGIQGDKGVIDGGEPGGYVLRFDDGTSVYHAGDTNVFGDMRLIGGLYEPQLAMLPIGGHFTMGPLEASFAARMLGVKTIIPMHYGTFPVLAGTPDQLVGELSGTDIQVAALSPGQTFSSAG